MSLSRTLLTIGTLTATCLLPTGCATDGTAGTRAERRRGPVFVLELVNQDVELDELEIDSDDNTIDGTDLRMLEKERKGIRFGVGATAGMFYVQLTREEFATTGLTLSSGGTGRHEFESDASIGLGGMGEPVLAQFNDQTALVLPFRAGMNFAVGETETALPADEEDYASVELEGEVGIGVNVIGIRPAVGLYGSSYALGIDDQDDNTLTGFNSGAFFDLRYKHPEFPLYVAGRAQSGDVDQDFLVTIGARF